MNVARGVVDALVSNGIDVVFGVPGNQTLPINRAIADRDDIEFVMARTEVAVPHMAWGYAESSGRLAATLVVPGPGDTHAMNGLKNALDDDVPMLHLVADVDPDAVGEGVLHEAESETYDGVVKANRTVHRPEAVVAEVQRAIATSLSHPQGPVRLAIPAGFLPADHRLAAADFRPQEPPRPDGSAVGAAADLLADSRSPVVIAGNGVRTRGATAELQAVTERLDAPVLTTVKAKGVVSEGHDLWAGVLTHVNTRAANRCLRESDVALAVGTGFGVTATQGRAYEMPDAVVHVSVSAEDMGRGYIADVGIVADERLTLEALLDRLPNEPVTGDDGASRAAGVRDATAAAIAENTPETSMNLAAIFEELRAAIPRDGVVCMGGAGGFHLWADSTFPVYSDRTYITTGAWTTMGTSVPSAIGAAYSNPDRPIVTVTGDGSLLMCVQELHTAAVENVPITTVVLNNQDYAIISTGASRQFDFPPGAYGWADDAAISYTLLADSLGVDAVAVESIDQVRETVASAIESRRPSLVEIPTEPDEPVLISGRGG